MSGSDDEEAPGGRTWVVRLSPSWLSVLFAAVALTAFAVSVEGGCPAWQAGRIALGTAVLAVAIVVVLDAVVGSDGVRIVVHVLPGLFLLGLAFLLTALQFADRFLAPPLYVVLVGHWVVGFSLLLGGVFVVLDDPDRVRRVAYIGLGATLVWTLVAAGYAVSVVLTRGRNVETDITAGAVSGWLLLIALVVGPSLVFLWDIRETRPESRNPVDRR